MPSPSRPKEIDLAGPGISQYEILQPLGEASSGPVYQAKDRLLDRLVALRVISPGLAGGDEPRRRLLERARLACGLEHPNVCQVYDAGETSEGGLFLVSALCEKPPLEERIRSGPARPEGAVELVFQVAAGVARAHELGLLHGRLRPGNVRVGTEGHITVVDFGLSGLDERTWLSSMPQPAFAPVAEAAGYLAPELLQGEAGSARSDVWSIGALLFALLRRKPPPRRTDFIEDELRQDTPHGELLHVLSRALSPAPASRHSHAGELRDDLRYLRRTASSGSVAVAGLPRAPADTPRIPKYRIAEQLGRGGMGVVYKAEDLQLGRTLALKFLSAELSSDQEAKKRFLQEARAASALDHPNICTIFEFGETDENQLYLAMPCYEGETLKARLSRGPLPVAEALDLALQTVLGLAKAHRQGIVHRDIKPANLMLTGDGLIKILDFGVAKLAGDVGVTRAGCAVGTPSYMSPEQIRGEDIDGRTDLWSVGVLLYEMLAGRRPFAGDNPEAVRCAILSGEPEPLTRLRSDIPASLEQVVRGLLSPDPARRYPTAEAVAAALRSHPGFQATSTPVTRRRRPLAATARMLVLGVLGVLGIAGVAGIAAGVLRLRHGSESRDTPGRMTFTQITDREGEELFPDLSPDASFFVYNKIDGNDHDIFLQRVGGGNPINLTADSDWDDTDPVYSPDGKQIAFRSERDGGGIFLMGATGESVRRLADTGHQPAWSPDGRQIAFATEPVTDPTVRKTLSQVWRMDIETGRRWKVAEGGALQPTWSPGGRRIAYWGGFGDGSTRKALWTVPVHGGRPAPLLEEKFYNWRPAWAPDGRSLYFLSDRSGSMNLWRVPVDEASGARTGEPEPVTIPTHFVSYFSVSRDGHRLLYATEEGGGSVDRMELTADGRSAGPLRPVTHIKRKILSAVPSPDGQWIVMYAQSPQEDLFLMRSDGTGFRQLTDDAYHDRLPRWSADGKLIYFYTDRNERYEVWTIRPDGSAAQMAVTRKPGEVFSPVPSPDGRWLACRDFSGAAMVDLSRPPAQRAPVPFIVQGLGNQTFVPRSWSPDMKWLAGTLHDKATMSRQGIGLYSPASEAFDRLPASGAWPTFLGGERTLLYLEQGKVHGWDRKTRRSWVVAVPPAGSVFRFFAPGPDQRSLYFVRETNEGDIWLLDSKPTDVHISSGGEP